MRYGLTSGYAIDVAFSNDRSGASEAEVGFSLESFQRQPDENIAGILEDVKQYALEVTGLTFNSKNGRLFFMYEEENPKLIYYFTEGSSTVIYKIDPKSLDTVAQLEDLNAQCQVTQQSTSIGTFGSGNFFRYTKDRVVSYQELQEFLFTQQYPPAEDDVITIPGDVLTGTKQRKIFYSGQQWQRIADSTAEVDQSPAQKIIGMVEKDHASFLDNRGPLWSRHLVCIKTLANSWEIRLLARPMYPLFYNSLKLFIVDGQGTALVTTVTEPGDDSLSIRELFAASVNPDNFPMLAGALAAFYQDPSLRISAERESTNEVLVRISFNAVLANTVATLVAISQRDEDKEIFGLFLFRTLVNLSLLKVPGQEGSEIETTTSFQAIELMKQQMASVEQLFELTSNTLYILTDVKRVELDESRQKIDLRFLKCSFNSEDSGGKTPLKEKNFQQYFDNSMRLNAGLTHFEARLALLKTTFNESNYNETEGTTLQTARQNLSSFQTLNINEISTENILNNKYVSVIIQGFFDSVYFDKNTAQSRFGVQFAIGVHPRGLRYLLDYKKNNIEAVQLKTSSLDKLLEATLELEPTLSSTSAVINFTGNNPTVEFKKIRKYFENEDVQVVVSSFKKETNDIAITIKLFHLNDPDVRLKSLLANAISRDFVKPTAGQN